MKKQLSLLFFTTLTLFSATTNKDFTLKDGKGVILNEPTNTYSTKIKSNDNLNTNLVLTLPSQAPSDNQILVVNSNGNLSWTDNNSSSLGSDNQKIDNFVLEGTTIKLSLEDDGEADKTIDISSINDDLNSSLTNHISNTNNPHNVTKSQVGLSNVDNTSDADKPVSSATKTALDAKSNISDIVDNLTSTDTNKPLSANQGTVLKDLIEDVNSSATLWIESDGNITRVSGNVGIGTSTPTQKLDIKGNIALEDTNSTETGVIYKDGVPFIHNFSHPTGNNAVPDGKNTFIGLNAGNFTMGSDANNTYEASYNTAIGYLSFYSNTLGYGNTALGFESLYDNTSGNENTAQGVYVLYSNTTGNDNTAQGVYALYSNTTGNNNTAIGIESLGYNTTGNYNTIVGSGAGKGTENSSDINGNALFGYRAGYSLQTGADYNTLLGYGAGYNIETGANNIIIGNSVSAPDANKSNQLNIGNVIYSNDMNSNRVNINNILRLEPRAEPSNPLQGDIYMDNNGTLRAYDGSNWHDLY